MRTSFICGLLLASVPLGAQQATLATPAELLSAPNARILAMLKTGASVTTGSARQGFIQVTVQGYVATRSLGPPRDSFALTIKDASAELRTAAATNASSKATLRQGMGVALVQRSGDWALVSRTGWVRQSAVRAESGRAVASTRPAPQPARSGTAPVRQTESPPAPSYAAPGPDSSDLLAVKSSTLRDTPGGKALGTFGDSARMRALYRERGWVRVRIEGWMRADDVTESDTALRTALMPADLRADPVSTRGKLIRWDVQKLAIQNADPLQRDLAQDEPYMLARGPGADHPLLYLSIPPSLLVSARKLPALGFFTVIARVRNGKSSPGGVPILDVLSLVTK